MTEPSGLKPCSYFIVRYASNLLRGEGSNIGILLHCPEEKYLGCLFAEDFRWLRRSHPGADLKLLGALQQDFEEQIEQNEGDQEGYLKMLAESLSNAIQLDGPRRCLLEDTSTGIQELYARNISRRGRSAPAVSSETRLGIKHRLTAAFVRAGVWERLEKRIPVRRWTQPGDPFTFDYGYKPNGVIHFVHALSLQHDTQLAKTLIYTLDCVRRHDAADLTAVVGTLPEVHDEAAIAARDILLEGHASIQPLAGIEAFAESISRELLGA